MDELEFVLVCDRDDDKLQAIYDLTNTYAVNIAMHVRPRTVDNYFARDYYNFGAALTCGENVMMMNDDCTLETKDWDDVIRAKVGTRKIYLLDTWDTTYETGGRPFSKFPIISREALMAVGFFFYPHIRMWANDNIICNLYDCAGATIKCHEVVFNHEHVLTPRFVAAFNQDYHEGKFPVIFDPELARLREAQKKFNEVPEKAVTSARFTGERTVCD